MTNAEWARVVKAFRKASKAFSANTSDYTLAEKADKAEDAVRAGLLALGVDKRELDTYVLGILNGTVN